MRKLSEKILLLDTHVWIWLMNGADPLKSSKILPQIEEGVKNSLLRVSAISVWEVAMLEAKGRIHFSLNCLDWVEAAVSAPGISLVPLTPEIAVESTRLPGKFQGDPADRILVATARKLNAILITQDKEIVKYGQQNYLSVRSL